MSKDKRTTIASVEVENFRRLTVAKVRMVPSKGLVRVTGDNAAGKTSLLKAVASIFGGDAEVDAGSLKDGTKRGRVFVQLTNGWTLERKITESNPKGAFVIKSPEGKRHGQGKVNDWLGHKSFDPMAFLLLSPAKQRDVLFSIGTDPNLPGKLEQVREEHDEVREERTPVISRKRHLSALAYPTGDRPEAVDTSAEMMRLGELQAEDRVRGDAMRKSMEADHAVTTAERLVDTSVAEVERIEGLLRDAHNAVTKDQATLKAASDEAIAARSTAESLPNPTDAMAEVSARLQQASEIQSALEPWSRYDEGQDELRKLEDEEAHLTARLAQLKTREADLLEKAGIPVKGLSFGEGGEPLLNGRSLSLASGRERIDMAVDVAIAADPEIGVCLLDEEANSLDLEAMERLDERANEEGFQIWCCRVGTDSPGEIVVEDGVASDAVPA